MITRIKQRLPNSFARSIKQIYLSLRGLLYSGTKYNCNLCHKSFRKMMEGGFDLPIIKEKQIIGAGIRNHICPYCQSTDRDRLVKLYLDNHFNLTDQPIKVLHIAPEPSLNNMFNKLDNVNYIPAAKYHEGIYYPDNLTLVDLTDMHFEEAEFDLIICNHVLEHIEEDNLAFSEIYRVLRKGGTAILQVPYSELLDKTHEDASMTTYSQREKHFGQFDHVRLYGKDYQEKLETAGFKVTLFNPLSIDAEKKVNKLSLFKGEKLFVTTKP